MSSDLDLRELHRVHDPDPAFVALLRARLESVAADSPDTGSTSTKVDVEPVAGPAGLPRHRWLLRVAAAAVVIAGIVAAASITRTDDPASTETDTVPTTTTIVDPSLAVFIGGWRSVDGDGSRLMMTIDDAGDGTAEMTVLDDAASVCAGAPSTMTGTGAITSAGVLVIAAPEFSCDDGTAPEALSGPPLEDQLRDLTFAPDGDDTLTDSLGGAWRRAGADDDPTVDGSEQLSSGGMWPQSTLEEVRAAQELADAGDPAYVWQVDAQLASEEGWSHLVQPGRVELVDRFLREELGWEAYLFSVWQGTDGDGASDGVHRGSVFLRCAPGRTNPLYPPGRDGRLGETCAPTLDDLRYETVSVDIAQLDQRGPDGIWVVSDWRMTAPFAQADPVVAEADATALLEEFLSARIAGDGAEGYVAVPTKSHIMLDDMPLLYATSGGARYERFEIERISGPTWPYGEMEFTVRLFADGGDTVVEQPISFYDSGGGLQPTSNATATTENGRSVFVPYAFFDGDVTVTAEAPWEANIWTVSGLSLGSSTSDELVQFTRDPFPAATGCTRGPAAADAAALAQAIRSNPELETTVPVAVTVGGAGGLQMEVTQAPDATTCLDAGSGRSLVLTKPTQSIHQFADSLLLGPSDRMRLYLIDLPEGTAEGVLVVAVIAGETRFDAVVEAAAPIIDSLELHTEGS